MAGKTHTTAVVLIPPEDLWEPIQAIRRLYDRQVRRWMPHITLIYPFRQRQEFDALAGPLEEACGRAEPFDLELTDFRWFSHSRRSFTLWLAPQPRDKLRQLQEALWRVVPDCDDARRHAGGFTPHLSVGQVRDQHQLERLVAELEANWQPIRFGVQQVSLIWRNAPPDDVFGVERNVSIGQR